jgi:hypothetical protein
VITKQMFGRRLRQLKPDLQEDQRVLNGKKHWVYLGITLRDGEPPELGDEKVAHQSTCSVAASRKVTNKLYGRIA